MILFFLWFCFIGFLEMVLWALQTKALIRDRIVNTFILTYISVIIWCYAVENVASQMDKISLMQVYALGCALGATITIKFDRWLETLAQARIHISKHSVNKRINKVKAKIREKKKR